MPAIQPPLDRFDVFATLPICQGWEFVSSQVFYSHLSVNTGISPLVRRTSNELTILWRARLGSRRAAEGKTSPASRICQDLRF